MFTYVLESEMPSHPISLIACEPNHYIVGQHCDDLFFIDYLPLAATSFSLPIFSKCQLQNQLSRSF